MKLSHFFSLAFLFYMIVAKESCAGKEAPEPTHVTADAIIFEQALNRATAEGNAIVKKGDATLYAKKLEVYFKKVGNKNEIALVKAYHNVRIERPENVAKGDFGTYTPSTEQIILEGHVSVTDHKNQISGAYGIMDQKTGVTKVLNHKPGTQPTKTDRVSALLVSND